MYLCAAGRYSPQLSFLLPLLLLSLSANIEARAPIKRTKRGIANAAHEAFENCEKETNNASGDTGRVLIVFASTTLIIHNLRRASGYQRSCRNLVMVKSGSPDKKRRLEEDEVMDGDEDDCMDVEPEAHLEKRKPQEKRLSLDPPRPSQQPNSRLIGELIRLSLFYLYVS